MTTLVTCGQAGSSQEQKQGTEKLRQLHHSPVPSVNALLTSLDLLWVHLLMALTAVETLL